MSGEAAHHLGRVLRAEAGQLYELSDGARVRLGRVERVGRDRVEFALLDEVTAYRPAVETTLLLSIVKFDAFEWALEKATELGVGRIVPLAAGRSDKALIAAAGKRAERWRKILLEASQQARRVSVPLLEATAKPAEGFGARAEELRILLSERAEAPRLRSVIGQHSGAESQGRSVGCREGAQHAAPLRATAVLAIGPEGGWTEEEIEAARKARFCEASMGKLILRTETAVVAALAAVNFAVGE